MMSALASPMNQSSTALRGRLVAKLLNGAWRKRSPVLESSPQELAEIASLLLSSGAGSLAWCRVRNSDLRTVPVAYHFRQEYRIQSLQAALHHRSLKKIIPLLRTAGVEPVLVKGWAIARLYPELGMRPYTDIDLCVTSDHYSRAMTILKSPKGRGCDVDLHVGFSKFDARETEDVFEHSELVRLDDLEVRVPSSEDHLRFLGTHLLRHGAVRPLWLCDIALMVETRGDEFDWDRCLAGSRRQADWIACVIGLAHQLLGVEVDGTPVAQRAKNLPRWMVPAVLKEWGIPYSFPAQVEVYLRNPFRMWQALLNELPRHWPNPIEATASVQGPFNNVPRLPFQLGHVASRGAALLGHLPGLLNRRSS
jgi:hypothetical protein